MLLPIMLVTLIPVISGEPGRKVFCDASSNFEKMGPELQEMTKLCNLITVSPIILDGNTLLHITHEKKKLLSFCKDSVSIESSNLRSHAKKLKSLNESISTILPIHLRNSHNNVSQNISDEPKLENIRADIIANSYDGMLITYSGKLQPDVIKNSFEQLLNMKRKITKEKIGNFKLFIRINTINDWEIFKNFDKNITHYILPTICLSECDAMKIGNATPNVLDTEELLLPWIQEEFPFQKSFGETAVNLYIGMDSERKTRLISVSNHRSALITIATEDVDWVGCTPEHRQIGLFRSSNSNFFMDTMQSIATQVQRYNSLNMSGTAFYSAGPIISKFMASTRGKNYDILANLHLKAINRAINDKPFKSLEVIEYKVQFDNLDSNGEPNTC